MAIEQRESSINGQSPEMKKFIEAYHLAEEAASDLIKNFKVSAEEIFNDQKVNVSNTKDDTIKKIKEKPLLSVGAAFAAGWIISKLLK